MMQKKEYIQYLRVFASLAVIMVHVAAGGSTKVEMGGQWYTVLAYGSSVRWAVPVFYMITGMLLLNPDREIGMSKLFGKYIKRMAIIWVVWSFVYAVIDIIPLVKSNTVLSEVKSVFINSFTNGHYHMSYVFILISFYLFLPLVKPFTKMRDQKLVFYIIAVWFVFSGLGGIITRFSSNTALKTFINYFTMNLCSSTLGFFLLGHFVDNLELKRKHINMVYIVGTISLIGTIIFTILKSIEHGGRFDKLWGYGLANTIFIAVAIFVFFKYDFRVNRIGKILLKISEYTLGIYLIHPVFVTLFKNNGLGVYAFHPIISIPVFSVVIFLISFMCVYVIKKIPIKFLQNIA